MTAEQMRITTNRVHAISSRLARSTADFVSKNGRFGAVFRTIVLKTQDDRRKCAFSMAIGLSKGCKRVFNKACAMPWCHTVVHFEVKMSHF